MINLLKRKKEKGFLLKLDFYKAFNSVLWGYLEEFLSCMGFGDRLKEWISQCLPTARVFVLVNGFPTKEFSMTRGLMQGDSMSLFLFNINIEEFNEMLIKGCHRGLIQGIFTVGVDSLRISYLQFTNDTLSFSLNSSSSLLNIKRIMRCFELISGLRVNFHKISLIGMGIKDLKVASIGFYLNATISPSLSSI